MKRLSFIFALVILLAGGAIGAMSAPAYAQGYGGYNYPPPPQNPYATPWVGPNTPWTFYQGDWFLNGILYNFFGNQYGWAPYYAYPPTYIVRPNNWYGPKWNAWYQGHPHYWQIFNNSIPIGADTMPVSIMTRIFIISTIVARGEVGIKDSMAVKRPRW